MTGVERAGQAEPDETVDDPDYVPNPPYDLPAGVTSWGEWTDR